MNRLIIALAVLAVLNGCTAGGSMDNESLYNKLFTSTIENTENAINNPSLRSPFWSEALPVEYDKGSKYEITSAICRLFEVFTWVSDIDKYGVNDKWNFLPEDKEGDCEDYHLSLMDTLLSNGLVKPQNIRLVIGETKGGSSKFEGKANHCWLQVFIDGEWYNINYIGMYTNAEIKNELKAYLYLYPKGA